MGWFNSDGNKDGSWLEGERSHEHTHRDGTRGHDVEAYRNTYSDDHMVSRDKATDYGKIHERNSGGK